MYENEAMQFLHIRWGKIVEDHLFEDTYKLFVELQQRLDRDETNSIEGQSIVPEHIEKETSKGVSIQ